MSRNGSPREAYKSNEWLGLLSPSSSSSNAPPGKKRGIVLVFDLDDTIAPYNTNTFSLNPEIISILKRAIEVKGASPRNVSGIFLYTNNSDKRYIDFIHGLVSKEVGVLMNIFDDILWASPGISNSRQKTLADIRSLCVQHGISTEDLANRTYFFDDQIHPDLYYKLPHGHYVLIKSRSPSLKNDETNRTIQGYTPGFNSATNFTTVHSALGMSGGRRKARNRTRKYKKRYTRRH